MLQLRLPGIPAAAFLTLVSLALAPGGAGAQEWEPPRLDHRNQPAILATLLYEPLLVTASEAYERSEQAAVADLAFGLPLDEEGSEGYLGLRIGAGEQERRLVAPHLFYRRYHGYEEWKTFFDAGLMLRVEPLVALAARIGLGAQYELDENWGVLLTGGASIGYGQGLQIGVDVGLGLQFRFGNAG